VFPCARRRGTASKKIDKSFKYLAGRNWSKLKWQHLCQRSDTRHRGTWAESPCIFLSSRRQWPFHPASCVLRFGPLKSLSGVVPPPYARLRWVTRIYVERFRTQFLSLHRQGLQKLAEEQPLWWLVVRLISRNLFSRRDLSLFSKMEKHIKDHSR
jgi:hypothetical protein